MLLRLNYDFTIATELIHLKIDRGTKEYGMIGVDGVDIVLTMPKGFEFNSYASQAWANTLLVKALRERAKIIFPRMVNVLADQFHLRYGRVFVKDVSSRWGSCSELGNINLSLWLLLAPLHLVEYVVKHELAHLNEMNHGPRFWSEVDRLCGGTQAGKKLEKEMKVFSRTLAPMILKK